MKYHLLFILIVFNFSSCVNKNAKEKLAMENVKQIVGINQIVGIGKIIPENDIILLSSPVSGIVQKIYIKENDIVNVGTIVLELNHKVEDEKIIQFSNQLTTQALQIKVDETNVSELLAKVSNANKELRRLQNLLLKAAETQQTVDDAMTNLKSLNANLDRLKVVVALSKSKRQELKTELKTAQLQRDQKIIRSPIKGKILELTSLIGGAVSMQESLAQISPDGRTIAICEIDESNAGKIEVGQKGWIRNVGSSDTLSTGSVYFIASFLKKKSLFTDQSGEKEDRRVRTVKMLLNHPEFLLLNKRVECVITISNNLKN